MKTIALHILDITENSVRANASLIVIEVIDSIIDDKITIRISDNGCGLSEDHLKSVMDPFFTSRKTRKVGMGIPLFKQNAELTGGRLSISSTLGEGTTVEAFFKRSHLDCPSMGDLAEIIALISGGNCQIDFEFIYTSDNGIYQFKTTEVKEIFGDMPINLPDVIHGMQELIESNLDELKNIYKQQ